MAAESAVEEAAVAESAVVETVLESDEVYELGAGLADRAVRVEPVMGAPYWNKFTVWSLNNSTKVLGMQG